RHPDGVGDLPARRSVDLPVSDGNPGRTKTARRGTGTAQGPSLALPVRHGVDHHAVRHGARRSAGRRRPDPRRVPDRGADGYPPDPLQYRTDGSRWDWSIPAAHGCRPADGTQVRRPLGRGAFPHLCALYLRSSSGPRGHHLRPGDNPDVAAPRWPNPVSRAFPVAPPLNRTPGEYRCWESGSDPRSCWWAAHHGHEHVKFVTAIARTGSIHTAPRLQTLSDNASAKSSSILGSSEALRAGVPPRDRHDSMSKCSDDWSVALEGAMRLLHAAVLLLLVLDVTP